MRMVRPVNRVKCCVRSRWLGGWVGGSPIGEPSSEHCLSVVLVRLRLLRLVGRMHERLVLGKARQARRVQAAAVQHVRGAVRPGWHRHGM